MPALAEGKGGFAKGHSQLWACSAENFSFPGDILKFPLIDSVPDLSVN